MALKLTIVTDMAVSNINDDDDSSDFKFFLSVVRSLPSDYKVPSKHLCDLFSV